MSDLQAAGPQLHRQLLTYLEMFQREYELEFEEAATSELDLEAPLARVIMEDARTLLDNNKEPLLPEAINDLLSSRELNRAVRDRLRAQSIRERAEFALAREVVRRLASAADRVQVALLAYAELRRRGALARSLEYVQPVIFLFLAGWDFAAAQLCAPAFESAAAERITDDMLEAAGFSPNDSLNRRYSLQQRLEFERGSPLFSDEQRIRLNDLVVMSEKAAQEPQVTALRTQVFIATLTDSLATLFGDLAEYVMTELEETNAGDSDALGVSEGGGERENGTERLSYDREDAICLTRQLFGDGAERDRDTAITELAREFGYQRTSGKISHEIVNTLRTAVRRGILESSGSTLRIAARSIDDYDRGFLKDQFLASLGGRAWVDRDQAIRLFARWLGYRRTGIAIEEAARSAINGLIREAKLESAGREIRRTGY